ncbi:uncharacterized protein naf1 isoform X1 [Centroberyx gerrardi]
MDDKPLEENALALPTANEEEDEEMEVTVTTQLENLIVAPDNADTPSDANTHPEAEMGDANTHSAPVTPSVESVCEGGSVCKGDGVCAGEDREDDSSEDSDSDSSSSSSSSSCTPRVPVLGEDDDDDEGFSQPAPIKTRDEVLLEELPAVEEVSVSLPEDAELQPIGTVSSIIQQLVIIQSLKDMPSLTDDSIIFNANRLALGKVFEVFGPVSCPLYVLRFNSAEQISNKELTVGQTVFYTPAIKEYTGYILTQQLKLLKGSDASWKNDQEPPPEALDYSDDEQEQEAKRKKKHNSKKKRDNNITEKSQCRALALWLGLLCLLLLAGFIGLAIHRANCSKGEWNIGSSCYFISTEQKNWEESRQACADRQSHLMIINSKDEQDILNILNRSVWIGLTDREQEGTWKWVDGTSLTTQFWYPPQPDNSGQGEDCVEFHNENLPSRGWNDNSCHNVNYWICERAIC